MMTSLDPNLQQPASTDPLVSEDFPLGVDMIDPPYITPEDEELFYALYCRKANQLDEGAFASTSTDLDGILTFAGLFSAVNSAFVAMTLTSSNPGVSNTTQTLVNAFFVASLCFNVLAALGAVLGKQWISRASQRATLPDSRFKASALNHQRTLIASRNWPLQQVLDFIPVVLQLAILWFWIAIIIYLWGQRFPVALIALLSAACGGVWYSYFLASALLDPNSPFQSPVSSLLRTIQRSLHDPYRIFEVPISLTFLVFRDALTVIFWLIAFPSICLISIITYILVLIPGLSSVLSSSGSYFQIYRYFGFTRPFSLLVAIAGKWSPSSLRVSTRLPRNWGEFITELYPTVTAGSLTDDQVAILCIRWSLMHIATDKIALEAARQLPGCSNLEYIRILVSRPLALRYLFIHFQTCLSKQPNAIDDHLTYVSAICHILLSQPNLTVPTGILEELKAKYWREDPKAKDRRDDPKAMGLREEVKLFTYVLEIGYAPESRNSGSSFHPTGKPTYPTQFGKNYETTRILPLIYLALSLPVDTIDHSRLVNSFAASLCASKAVSLLAWFFSDKDCLNEKQMVERRWKAYRSLDSNPSQIVSSLDFSSIKGATDDAILRLLGCVAWLPVLPEETEEVEEGLEWFGLPNLDQGSPSESHPNMGIPSALNYILNHKDMAVIVAKRPALLVRLASWNVVGESLRTEALKATRDQFQSVLNLNWAPGELKGGWGPKFVEGFVTCISRKVTLSDEDLIKLVDDIAKAMRPKEELLVLLWTELFGRLDANWPWAISWRQYRTQFKVALACLTMWAQVDSDSGVEKSKRNPASPIQRNPTSTDPLDTAKEKWNCDSVKDAFETVQEMQEIVFDHSEKVTTTIEQGSDKYTNFLADLNKYKRALDKPSPKGAQASAGSVHAANPV